MGKMMKALMLVFIVELAISLFITGCDPSNLQPGQICEESTSLTSLLLSPTEWSASNLLKAFKSDIFLVGGTVAITVGLLTNREFLLYAGIAGVFLDYAQSLFRLWQYSKDAPFVSEAGGLVATVFLGALFIYFIVTSLDFARGRD